MAVLVRSGLRRPKGMNPVKETEPDTLLESRSQGLGSSRLRRSVCAVEYLDDVAGMLRGRGGGDVLTNPIHQLHHVLVYVRFFQAAVGA